MEKNNAKQIVGNFLFCLLFIISCQGPVLKNQFEIDQFSKIRQVVIKLPQYLIKIQHLLETVSVRFLREIRASIFTGFTVQYLHFCFAVQHLIYRCICNISTSRPMRHTISQIKREKIEYIVYSNRVYSPNFFFRFTLRVLTTHYIKADGFRSIAVGYTLSSLGIEDNPCRPLRGGKGGGRVLTRPEEQTMPLGILSISGTLVPCFPSAFRA